MATANHGVQKFKATFELIGGSFSQSIIFQGEKCADHNDLTAYIAGLMRERLDNLTPGEVVGLRDQVKKLNSANASLAGEIAELKKQVADAGAAKMAAKKYKNTED
jgi:hypothetical protein